MISHKCLNCEQLNLFQMIEILKKLKNYLFESDLFKKSLLFLCMHLFICLVVKEFHLMTYSR